MKVLTTLSLVALVALPFVIAAQAPQGGPAAAPCVQQGNTQFVCGQTAPEDLAAVPGGNWMLATMYGGQGGIQIINIKDRSTTKGYPIATAKEQLDKKTYDTCPGPASASEKMNFRTHGIALREGRNSVHTVYVVTHSSMTREAIEVFELDAKPTPPTLTWIGCVIAPEPIGLNEVIPLPDGGFISTDFMARNIDAGARGRAMAGEANGALWEWHTGKGWAKIPGTEASAPNGLEISKDGKTLYVATWGDQGFFRITLGQNPPKQDKVPLGFRADNVRWAPDGTLFVTGQGGTGQTQTTNIVKIHPTTLKVTEVATKTNTPEFGAGTATLQIGKELWVGSYRGDRIATWPAP